MLETLRNVGITPFLRMVVLQQVKEAPSSEGASLSLLEQFQIHVERVGAIGGQLVLLMDGRAP